MCRESQRERERASALRRAKHRDRRRPGTRLEFRKMTHTFSKVFRSRESLSLEPKNAVRWKGGAHSSLLHVSTTHRQEHSQIHPTICLGDTSGSNTKKRKEFAVGRTDPQQLCPRRRTEKPKSTRKEKTENKAKRKSHRS